MSFSKLSRKAQLNCICNHAVKQRIATNVKDGAKSRGMFPLEPVGLFIGDNKMTSDTGEQIRFWAHRQLAKDFFHNHKKLSHSQFEFIDWVSVHQMLHGLPWLFQICAAKHVLEIAGMMKFLAHQDGRSLLCPSCQDCGETCTHIAHCPKIKHVAAFTQSMQGVEQWLGDQNTHPNLQSFLLRYLQGRGSLMCVKCSSALNLPHSFQEFAKSQDVIGWDNFVVGMVSSKLLKIQSLHLTESSSSICTTGWITASSHSSFK